MDGYNIMPFLTGKTSQSPRKEYGYFLHGCLQGLRVGQWKLQEVNGKIQLFNMQSDPDEHYNRAETVPEVVQQIRQQMKRLAEETRTKLSAKE